MYAFLVCQHSVRFRTLLLHISNQLKRGEKAIVFAQNPIEQQLITVVLRCVGIFAEAVLGTESTKKRHLLALKFNTELSSWGGIGLTDLHNIKV